jgi:DNA primase
MERKPSAGLRKSDGIFHCFACGEVHSLPEVISHCFGHDEDLIGTWGWTWLLKNFAIVQVEERKDVELDFSRDKKASNNNRVGIRSNNYISDEELDKYRYTHPYMYKRGLTDEVIELFDIGYDADSKCITFPIRDISGNVLFIARRSVQSKFFNYPEGVEKPLYGLYELYQQHTDHPMLDKNGMRNGFSRSYNFDTVIVCESMLDALSFWTVGKYAVALNGLGNELQFKQLRQLPCREIILATDMDERGLAARERIRKNLSGTKLIAEYFFPEGRKDANDCTKEELQNLKKHY